MKNSSKHPAPFLVTILLLSGIAAAQEGPLPKFTLQGIALHPDKLKWCPTEEIEHPAVIKMEGLVEKPLGKYYIYYGPHKHEGVGIAYSDSLAGPWTEYEGNPVVEKCAAPDIRWVAEKGRFQLWAHAKNSCSEMWTSKDGLHFEHHSVSVEEKKIGTKNATYTRFHEYPLKKYGSKYILLYVGFDQTAGVRHLWLAHSKDAENWTQVKTPFVSPGKGETSALYDPELFQWKGKNYIVYADNNVWRGGTLKYVEVDRDLTPVGAGGKRYTLMKGPEKIQGRLRSPQFIVADGKIHMISGAGKNPRVCAYSTADVDGPGLTEQSGKDRR